MGKKQEKCCPVLISSLAASQVSDLKITAVYMKHHVGKYVFFAVSACPPSVAFWHLAQYYRESYELFKNTIIFGTFPTFTVLS